MTSLQDFNWVRNNLKIAKKGSILALHKLIFEQEGDRNNRQRLRDFKGFDEEQYIAKKEYIKQNLTIAELISICILLGLNFKVDNPELLILENLCKGKLLFAMNQEETNDDDEDNEDTSPNNNRVSASDEQIKMNTDNNNYDDIVSQVQSMNTLPTPPRFALNFRDIEDSIRVYDGTSKIPIESWVKDFEETARIMGWDEFQKLVFAKKSLIGIAKMYIMSEKEITSWNKLKTNLIKEFTKKTNSAYIHKMLCERKILNNENVTEYFYNMKEIASRGNIENNALIHYVIDGIKDTNGNKAILYGAKNLDEFKEKLCDYQIYTSKQETLSNHIRQNEKKQHTTFQSKKPENKPDRCFNCGEIGHSFPNCPNKSKGAKCFKCNNFGHLAKNCKKNNNKKNEEKEVHVQCLITNKLMTKEVKISNIQLLALFDTGSQINIINSKIFRKLKKQPLSSCHILLTGFGSNQNKIRPLGYFNEIIQIDNESFELEFYVVNDKCMKVDVIIGYPLTLQAAVTFDPDGIHIHKIQTHEIMNINVEAINELESKIGESQDPKIKKKIYDIINNYKPQKTKTTNIEMKLILLDETPINCAPRRLPIAERKLVDEQVQKWLDEEIIENSCSEFCSPIVMVNKKDGTKRLCIDYRRLNKIIARDHFPLPLIEDQLDRLVDAKIFSTIDLKNGFFHVTVEESSRKYTSFVTHGGQFQFRKVPFGLSNSPPVFQRFINTIFRDLTYKGIALPYIDDIIIPAQDEQEAVNHLEQVIQLCQDYGLEINFKKCKFLQKRIEFLGHVIEDQKISPSVAKVEAMVKYPIPNNLKQVESFLGLAGYFRKFIYNFSRIAKPLSDLKKKEAKFIMQQKQLNAFHELKNALIKAPVLKIFNKNHQTELHTDASVSGYGAILMQKLPDDAQMHPVYFMSRKTSDQEAKYPSYELEILAVIQALKKFRVYLLGHKFKIITDCNAFATTMNKKDLPTRVARWLLLLQEYDYEIEHRSGVQMRHVDALSRNYVMMVRTENNLTDIKKAQYLDEKLKPIIEILRQNIPYEDYRLMSNVLFKIINDSEKIVIPTAMQHDLIKTAHEKGHFSAKKTKELISDDYYIPKLDDKIQQIILNCIPCLLVNRKRGKQEGILNPLPKPDTPLHTYHIDFIGPLETTNKQYKYILVVVDAFTKFCWLFPTKTTSTTCALSKLKIISVTFGNPLRIISDRGSAFTAEEFKNYCDTENIKHIKITTGLPRANGQVERMNAVVTSVLAKLAVDNPSKWYKHVDAVQQCINSTFSRSTNFTPFELLIGVKMRLKTDFTLKKMIEDEYELFFNKDREELRFKAKQQILKLQDENKRFFNLRRKKAKKYKIGDYVAIKRTQFGPGLKLKPKYLGPYQIAKVKFNDTYDVVKIGSSEGPVKTTTCSEYIKAWPDSYNKDDENTFGSNV